MCQRTANAVFSFPIAQRILFSWRGPNCLKHDYPNSLLLQLKFQTLGFSVRRLQFVFSWLMIELGYDKQKILRNWWRSECVFKWSGNDFLFSTTFEWSVSPRRSIDRFSILLLEFVQNSPRPRIWIPCSSVLSKPFQFKYTAGCLNDSFPSFTADFLVFSFRLWYHGSQKCSLTVVCF